MPYEKEAEVLIKMTQGWLAITPQRIKEVANYLDDLVADEIQEHMANQPEQIEPLDYSELD